MKTEAIVAHIKNSVDGVESGEEICWNLTGDLDDALPTQEQLDAAIPSIRQAGYEVVRHLDQVYAWRADGSWPVGRIRRGC